MPDFPLSVEEFQSEPTPPAMLRDFAAEMVPSTPPVPPVDGGNYATTILPLDADDGPPDLDEVVQSVTSHIAEQALEQLDGPDRDLHPIRSAVRPGLEPILARYSARLADIRNRAAPPGPSAADGDEARRLEGAEGLPANHPSRQALEALERRIRARGSLTDTGKRLELQAAAAERDAAIQQVTAQWGDKLDAVARDCKNRIDQGIVRVTDDDRHAGLLLVQELGATSPKHGLPLLQWEIREAALDPAARGPLLSALPLLRSLYENQQSPYGGSVLLHRLIRTANDLMASADVHVAQARLERIERTKWEIDSFVRNALDGGTEALDRDGRPVLLPPEPPPKPLPMPRSAPHPFRRLTSEATRAADEKRRRKRQDEEE